MHISINEFVDIIWYFGFWFDILDIVRRYELVSILNYLFLEAILTIIKCTPVGLVKNLGIVGMGIVVVSIGLLYNDYFLGLCHFLYENAFL